jgi:hypothetical protein
MPVWKAGRALLKINCLEEYIKGKIFPFVLEKMRDKERACPPAKQALGVY